MEQYEPMISAIMRKLHIYRDFELYRQAGRIALWQAWERFDAAKGDFTPFAYRSIYGGVLDELKKEARYVEHHKELDIEALNKPAQVEEVDELPEWLDAFSLSGADRELLAELFINGRSVVELTAHSSVSLAGMKKRRERLLKKIREELER